MVSLGVEHKLPAERFHRVETQHILSLTGKGNKELLHIHGIISCKFG